MSEDQENEAVVVEELLAAYLSVENAIHSFFGYEPQWRAMPLTDETDRWWCLLDADTPTPRVVFGGNDPRKALEEEDYYSSLCVPSTRVLRKRTHTMLCVDTQTDGNMFLSVFDNEKEVVDPDLVALIKEKR